MAARRRARWSLIAAAVVLLAVVPRGQEPVFRAAVETVRVDVSVTRGNRPVPGLTAAQFEVVDNGRAYPVSTVSREQVPLRLLLVLDTSGSLGASLPSLIEAATGLVRALRPDDQVGLVAFDQAVRIVVPPSTRHEAVVQRLGGLTASGPTAWRDALFVALQVLGDDPASRPVVLLFTDGADTASWMDADTVADAVRRSGVIVHSVGYRIPVSEIRNTAARRRIGMKGASRSLRRVVDLGGGRQWVADAPQFIPTLFATALDELRARYLISYSPPSPNAEGWHDVRVRVTGVRADVQARPGYFVPTR